MDVLNTLLMCSFCFARVNRPVLNFIYENASFLPFSCITTEGSERSEECIDLTEIFLLIDFFTFCHENALKSL